MIRLAFIVTSLAVLTSCAPKSKPPDAALSEGASVCKQIATLAREGRRANFVYDFAEGERNFREILRLLDTRGDGAPCKNDFDRAEAQINLGVSLSNQGLNRLANAALSEGEKLAEQKNNPRLRSLAKLHRAYHELNQQNTASARQFAQEGLEALTEGNSAVDSLSAASVLETDFGRRLFVLSPKELSLRANAANLRHTFAETLLSGDENDLKEALALNDIGLRAVDGIDGLPTSYASKFRAQRASIQIERGAFAIAEADARVAKTQLESELPNTPVTAQSILTYGLALERQGRLGEAKNAFEEAFAIYDSNAIPLSYEKVFPYVRILERGSSRSVDEFKIDRRKITSPEAVSALFRAGQLVKSSNTAKEIAATAAALSNRSGEGADAIRVWREADKQLQTLRAARTQSNNLTPEQRKDIEDSLSDALAQEATLRARRDDVAPEYREAIETPATLDEIQNKLEPGEALVQVLLGNPRSMIIFVTKEDAQVQLSDVNLTLLAARVSALTDAFPTGITDIVQTRQKFSPEISYGLAQRVFGPLLELIRKQEKIFVSTNGALQNIPFEVLVVEDPSPANDGEEGWRYADVRWLVDDIAISYLPSPRNLIDLRNDQDGSIASKSAIAFGDFLTDSENVAASRGARTAQLPIEECGPIIRQINSLDRLEGTAREVKAIGEALGEGTQIYTQQDFTEERIKALSDSGELADYRIVHFATHGLLWRSNDCVREPSLTTTVAAGSGEDGLLESSEIRQLNLNADLVVLSACETIGGDGQLGVGGENLVGLARAFFSSGARSVIASFWQAEDEPTAVLMATMYQRLADNPDTSFEEALRFAQGSVRRNTDRPEWANPVIWAPFVFVGDGSAKFRQAAG